MSQRAGAAQIPFFITARMKVELKQLGYTDDDIYHMRVDDAHKYLKNQIRKGDKPKKKAGSSIASRFMGSKGNDEEENEIPLVAIVAAFVLAGLMVYLHFF